MSDAGLAALKRYKLAAAPLPTEAGLYQATIRTHAGSRIRHMAKLGIDLEGRWFEFHECRVRVLDVSDIVEGTVREVDWTQSPEVRLSCVQQGH